MKKASAAGIVLALTTALISGFSVFYSKVAVLSVMDPWVSTFVKNAAVAVIILATFVIRRPEPGRKISGSDIPALSYIGIIGGGVAFLLFFTGLAMVPAIDGALLHKTQFIWVALLSPVLLAETATPVAVVGYLVILWSNLFLGGFRPMAWSIGHTMILSAAILWSLETVAIRKTAGTVGSRQVALIRMGMGSLLILAVLVATGKLGLVARLQPKDIPVLAGAIALLTGYVLTWTAALSQTKAATVAAILVIATPITNLLSAAFVTHALPQTAIIQAAATVLGITLITLLSGRITHHAANPQSSSTS
jgi:drug/metabolite transporter (DMT)-like permease